MSIRTARHTAKALEWSLRSLEAGRGSPDLEDGAPALPRTRVCGCVACVLMLILVGGGGLVTITCRMSAPVRKLPSFLRRFGEVRRDADGRLNYQDAFPNWVDEQARLDDVVMAISKIVYVMDNT
jgi:hypothetical protein